MAVLQLQMVGLQRQMAVLQRPPPAAPRKMSPRVPVWHRLQPRVLAVLLRR
jgi:hypothetical protein